jgi:uncharacterized protein
MSVKPPTKPRAEAQRIIGELCSSCALCCNGVLFGDVELQASDDPKALQQAGLKLQRKGKEHCLNQPCSCLDARNLCRIYSARPVRCRTFECLLLKRVLDGELDLAEAKKATRDARKQTQKVVGLLRELGQREEHLPLSRRYARLMAEPIDLAGDERIVELRSQLLLAVARLSKILGQYFLG